MNTMNAITATAITITHQNETGGQRALTAEFQHAGEGRVGCAPMVSPVP